MKFLSYLANIAAFNEYNHQYILLACWLIAPVTFSFMISQDYFRPPWMAMLFGQRKSIFITRNLITVIFPLLLLLAHSILLAPGRLLRAGLSRRSREAFRLLLLLASPYRPFAGQLERWGHRGCAGTR
jgi:hypothetical protein